MKEIKKVFARQLRKEPTKAEKVVWELTVNQPVPLPACRQAGLWERVVKDGYSQKKKLGEGCNYPIGMPKSSTRDEDLVRRF